MKWLLTIWLDQQCDIVELDAGLLPEPLSALLLSGRAKVLVENDEIGYFIPPANKLLNKSLVWLDASRFSPGENIVAVSDEQPSRLGLKYLPSLFYGTFEEDEGWKLGETAVIQAGADAIEGSHYIRTTKGTGEPQVYTYKTFTAPGSQFEVIGYFRSTDDPSGTFQHIWTFLTDTLGWAGPHVAIGTVASFTWQINYYAYGWVATSFVVEPGVWHYMEGSIDPQTGTFSFALDGVKVIDQATYSFSWTPGSVHAFNAEASYLSTNPILDIDAIWGGVRGSARIQSIVQVPLNLPVVYISGVMVSDFFGSLVLTSSSRSIMHSVTVKSAESIGSNSDVIASVSQLHSTVPADSVRVAETAHLDIPTQETSGDLLKEVVGLLTTLTESSATLVGSETQTAINSVTHFLILVEDALRVLGSVATQQSTAFGRANKLASGGRVGVNVADDAHGQTAVTFKEISDQSSVARTSVAVQQQHAVLDRLGQLLDIVRTVSKLISGMTRIIETSTGNVVGEADGLLAQNNVGVGASKTSINAGTSVVANQSADIFKEQTTVAKRQLDETLQQLTVASDELKELAAEFVSGKSTTGFYSTKTSSGSSDVASFYSKLQTALRDYSQALLELSTAGKRLENFGSIDQIGFKELHNTVDVINKVTTRLLAILKTMIREIN